MSAESKATYLRQYWADVRAGLREPPKRHANGVIRRITQAQLDASFGPDRNKRIVITLHPDGRLELRPEHTRRAETILLTDVYRFALKCRVNREVLTKAREKKERKQIRLAQERQRRAEKRLVWRDK